MPHYGADEAEAGCESGVPAIWDFRGGCACGSVRYRVQGPLRHVILCHCEICRRQTGGVVAATCAPEERLTFDEIETLTWWHSGPSFQRGFCSRCGGSLFWRRVNSGVISILVGTLDDADGLATIGEIDAHARPDYVRDDI